MSDESLPPEGDAAARAAGPDGVFERLPRRRPALRTPRRDRRRVDFEENGGAREPEAFAEAHDERETGRGGRRGLDPVGRAEDLTLAGIGAAADAVVIGLRLIERAYGGVRRGGGRH